MSNADTERNRFKFQVAGLDAETRIPNHLKPLHPIWRGLVVVLGRVGHLTATAPRSPATVEARRWN